MLPDHATFAKTNVFKAFFGFWQGNPLVQHNILRIPGFFVQNRVGYTTPMPTSNSIPPSLSPVTHRDGLCAGFKTQFGRCTMKQVFWLVEPMWSRGISPQISQYDQGRKVCRLKTGWLYATQAEDIARQSRANTSYSTV